MPNENEKLEQKSHPQRRPKSEKRGIRKKTKETFEQEDVSQVTPLQRAANIPPDEQFKKDIQAVKQKAEQRFYFCLTAALTTPFCLTNAALNNKKLSFSIDN